MIPEIRHLKHVQQVYRSLNRDDKLELVDLRNAEVFSNTLEKSRKTSHGLPQYYRSKTIKFELNNRFKVIVYI